MTAGCVPPGSIYFGKPGALVTIPWPRTGIQRTRPRNVNTFGLDSGGTRVGKMIGGTIQYVIGWEALLWPDFEELWRYEQGHNGLPPWVLLDPRVVNLLTTNQSGATSEVNDIDDFTLVGVGGTITSDAVTTERGYRALMWLFDTATPGVSTVTLTSPSPEWTGVPVRASTGYTFIGRMKLSAGTAVEITPEILWYTSAGVYISTSSGVAVTSGAGWATLFVDGTSPANAAFALCRLEATSATIAIGDAVNFDELMFGLSTQIDSGSWVYTDWIAGVGIQPVDIVTLTPDVHHYATSTTRVNSPTLTLQEVRF